MNNAKNLHTVEQREVQHEDFTETVHTESPQRFEGRMFEAEYQPMFG